MPSTPNLGWPFLVAPGRRRDYSTLLAPDFLVAELDYGVLSTAIEPTATNPDRRAGPPTVTNLRTAGGRELSVVSATHLLSTVDLDDAPAGARDEHNRPLRLIYGFLSPDGLIAVPDESDLDTARVSALETYRQFLTHEETATVTPAAPFPLRSVVQPRESSTMVAQFAAVVHDGHRPHRTVIWLGAAAAAGAAAVALIIGFTVSSTDQPAPCPSTTVASGQFATPQPTTPQPTPSCPPSRAVQR